MTCVRCGGPTTKKGVCSTGRRHKTCGHWWRRDGGCREPDPDLCGCRWDHKLFFLPTMTVNGMEHRYHAPGGCGVGHNVVVVVRPKGTGRRLHEIEVSPPTGSLALQRQVSLRIARLYQLPA